MPNAGRARRRGAVFVLLALFALFATTLILVAVQSSNEAYNTSNSTTYHVWAVVAFFADLLVLTGVVLGIGYAVTGDLFGVALSSWNDYSLSKLQMALWTIVVLAGLLTAAKINLLGYFGPVPAGHDVLQIDIPGELLAAMGIAAFSTAATPAILALKASQTPGEGEVAAAQQRLTGANGANPSSVINAGKAIGRAAGEKSSWLDIVTGDEAANAGLVDLSKVQQLLVTLLLVGTYVFLLARLFAHAGGEIGGLPELSERFIELLAISHAGYLVYKATPKAAQPPSGAGANGATGGLGGPPPTPGPVPMPKPLPPRQP